MPDKGQNAEKRKKSRRLDLMQRNVGRTQTSKKKHLKRERDGEKVWGPVVQKQNNYSNYKKKGAVSGGANGEQRG